MKCNIPTRSYPVCAMQESQRRETLNIFQGLSQARALGHKKLLQELCSKLASVF